MAKLRKLSVVYHAPEGDSRVVDNMGSTFFDGQPTEIYVSPEDEERLRGSSIFEVVSASDFEGDKAPAPVKPKATAKTEEHNKR